MLNKKKSYFVSIVIPAFNEEKNIGRCLNSIANMNLMNDNYEVIIVDNGSIDKTCDIVNTFKDKINVKLLIHPHVHIAALRNIGVSQSMGDIIAFVDADCTVSNNWIDNALRHFQDNTIGAVGCSVDIPEKVSWVSRVWDLNNLKKRKQGFAQCLPTGNLIVRKEYFLKVKGFNENLVTNEDFDFCYRLSNGGYKIYSDPEIKVIHWGIPEDLIQFYRRGKWHGTHVFNVFLDDIWKLKNVRAISYALYYTGCIFCLFLGLFDFLINGKSAPMLGFTCALVLPPLLLSLKTIANQKKSLRYFLPLSVLYFTYGIARAASLVTNIRNLISRKKEKAYHWSSTKHKKI